MITEKQIHIITLLAIARLFNEQSTFCIGEFRQENKMRFNNAVAAAENFTKAIEATLNDFDKETLVVLTDSMHDGIKNLKQELIKELRNN